METDLDSSSRLVVANGESSPTPDVEFSLHRCTNGDSVLAQPVYLPSPSIFRVTRQLPFFFPLSLTRLLSFARRYLIVIRFVSSSDRLIECPESSRIRGNCCCFFFLFSLQKPFRFTGENLLALQPSNP